MATLIATTYDTLENLALASTLADEASVLANAAVVEAAGVDANDSGEDSSIETDARTDRTENQDTAELDVDDAEFDAELILPLPVKTTRPLWCRLTLMITLSVEDSRTLPGGSQLGILHLVEADLGYRSRARERF